jgi:c-di-GMP-binding flagellar brake protein YcgR
MWLDNGTNETIMTNTSNLSVGGMCVYLNQDVDLGIRVDVQLNFDEATSFSCIGTVVRSTKEKDNFYSAGIRFEPLDEMKTSFLNAKISEIVRQKGKD